jgi:hypothetical protein
VWGTGDSDIAKGKGDMMAKERKIVSEFIEDLYKEHGLIGKEFAKGAAGESKVDDRLTVEYSTT